MLLQQAFETFIADRRINGCAAKTIEFYRYAVGKILTFAHHRGARDTENLHEVIGPYFLHLHESQLSTHSIHTLHRGLRAFALFLAKEGFVERHPRLPHLRPATSVIEPLSVDHLRVIMGSIRTDSFVGLRDATIIRLLFDTGIRLGELTRIELPHVNFEEGFMFIRGKGNRERWVPVGKEMKKALWIYVKQRELYSSPSEPALFVRRDGNRLSARGIQQIFKRIKPNLPKSEHIRLSAHILRHSFALAYIEAGGDPFSLQRILGHSTQAMTAKYVNMARSNIKAQHDRFSPGDRL